MNERRCQQRAGSRARAQEHRQRPLARESTRSYLQDIAEHAIEQDVQTLRFITDPKIHYVLLRKCVSLLVLDSVTSTPQWIRQPKPRDIVQKNSSMWPFFNVAWATFNTLSAQEFASAA